MPRAGLRKTEWMTRLLAAALTLLILAPAASAATRFERIAGYARPARRRSTTASGILKIGRANARNVLVLNPGTSASAAYFAPLAKTSSRGAQGWQVWAVERRENLLEDQSVLNRAKAGKATPQQLFDYYLGWLTDPRSARTSSSSRTRRSATRASGA